MRRNVLMPEALREELTKRAKELDVSVNHLIVEFCEYCLKNNVLPENSPQERLEEIRIRETIL